MYCSIVVPTILTIFALALFDGRLVLDVLVAGLAVEPCSKRTKFSFIYLFPDATVFTSAAYLLTSSAD